MTQNEFQRAAGISAGLAARWYPHLLATFAEFSIEASGTGNVYCSGWA